MSALNRLEDLLERLVETGFARLARARLQPVEIAKRAARVMERQQIVGVSRVLVPNYYDIWLHPDDFAHFAAIMGTLQAEVASYLQDYAAQHSFALPGPPVVAIGEDAAVRPRQVHVEARLEDPMTPEVEEREEGIQSTSVMPPVSIAPSSSDGSDHPAMLVYLTGPNGRRYDLEPGVVTLGRSLENMIALDDKRISRYHARLRYAGGHWTLSDLNSTNGTFVNGRQIKQRTVLEGDLISLGGLELTFHQTWAP
ncbi:MAG: DUF3662 and FHA domain-containing protein [Chloroflexota bacterium]